MNAFAKLTLTLLALLSLADPLPARGGVPQPSYVLYGLVADEFGWPYLTNATVTLWLNNVSNQTCVVSGLVAPGVNFRFDLSLDSGTAGVRYSSKAARSGDQVRVMLSANGVSQTVIQSTNLPPIGKPGETRAINLTAGTDSDGDGLPDEWEQWIIMNDFSLRLKSILDVKPEDDADGDGVSNIDEYRAGTDPANGRDYFYLEQTAKTNGRFQFIFLTVPGKTYNFLSADANVVGNYQWSQTAYSASPDGAFQMAPIIGTGHFITIFSEATGAGRIFKASVK